MMSRFSGFPPAAVAALLGPELMEACQRGDREELEKLAPDIPLLPASPRFLAGQMLIATDQGALLEEFWQAFNPSDWEICPLAVAAQYGRVQFFNHILPQSTRKEKGQALMQAIEGYQGPMVATLLDLVSTRQLAAPVLKVVQKFQHHTQVVASVWAKSGSLPDDELQKAAQNALQPLVLMGAMLYELLKKASLEQCIAHIQKKSSNPKDLLATFDMMVDMQFEQRTGPERLPDISRWRDIMPRLYMRYEEQVLRETAKLPTTRKNYTRRM